MITYKEATPPEYFAQKHPSAKDWVIVTDQQEIARIAVAHHRWSDKHPGEWYGYRNFSQAQKLMVDGDLNIVPKSDKLLSEFESVTPTARAFITRDNIVGSLPNIPAYLAGNPYNMRRRFRTITPQAPLCVVVDLTSSASIQSTLLIQRGVALLALVRYLTNLRPVELWLTTAVGTHNASETTLIRIDTTPLDLARTAYMISCPSFGRGICYDLPSHLLDSPNGPAWPYEHNVNDFRSNAAKYFNHYIPSNNEIFYVAPVHAKDDCITDPVTWLHNMIKQYSGVNQDAA